VRGLEVRDLTRCYSDAVVVGPLSFTAAEGEFVSLLGPSGCGKTTTLRCIAGFETPTTGEIHLRGKRIDREPPNRRDIGLVFQSYALFPHLTVFDNIAFGLRLRRLSKAEQQERVTRMLALVDLPHVASRYPAQLSGGQQQRVAIARSLVLEPSLLLFDEPLSNLDFKLRVTMRQELRNLQRRLGKTSIYVTHDQSEALALSDRIIVLSHGRIEQIGTPEEIYERPATPFVADFIGNSNLIKGEIVEADGAESIVRSDHGLALRVPASRPSPSLAVTLVVRPEKVRLLRSPAGEPNVFSARVEDVTYLAQDTHVRLVLAGRQPLTAVIQGDRLREGDTVSVEVPVSAIHVLQG